MDSIFWLSKQLSGVLLVILAGVVLLGLFVLVVGGLNVLFDSSQVQNIE